MMKTYTIYAGDKATFENGSQLTFECDTNDTDTAYDAIAEEIRLNNQDQDDNQDLVDFENVKDDDVEVMLNDLKAMNFISSWEVED